LPRARDTIFSDKTEHNVKMSKVITQYLRYIEELYKIIEKHIDTAKLDEVFKKIHKKYKCDKIFVPNVWMNL
jgi:NTE family protein